MCIARVTNLGDFTKKSCSAVFGRVFWCRILVFCLSRCDILEFWKWFQVDDSFYVDSQLLKDIESVKTRHGADRINCRSALLCLHCIVVLTNVFIFLLTLPDETDAKMILTCSPLENWRRPPGRLCTMWMKTIQQYLKSNNLSLIEAVDVAQNQPLLTNAEKRVLVVGLTSV